MDNNIDKQLNEISNSIPSVNPNLRHQIYQKAINQKQKSKLSFFNLSFKIALPTFVSVFLICVLMIVMITNNGLFKNESINDITDSDNIINDNNNSTDDYIGDSDNADNGMPPLSPDSIVTFSLKNVVAYSNEFYDVMTIEINNSIHNQVIYIKENTINISNIVINNGDIEINKNTKDNEVIYKLTIYNYYTTSHYIDLYFEKGTFDSKNYNINLLVLLNLKEPDKSYGYDFVIDNFISFDEGDN